MSLLVCQRFGEKYMHNNIAENKTDNDQRKVDVLIRGTSIKKFGISDFLNQNAIKSKMESL